MSSTSPRRSKRLKNEQEIPQIVDTRADNDDEDEGTIDLEFVDSYYEVDKGDDMMTYLTSALRRMGTMRMGRMMVLVQAQIMYHLIRRTCIFPRMKFPVFRPNTDMTAPKFKVGMVLGTMDEVRGVIHEYSIKNRVDIKTPKNENTRLRAHCDAGCSWFLYASKDSRANGIMVKTYVSKHACHRKWENR